MTAKENTKYAIIVNNEVSQIFNGNDIKEWNENDLLVVEIPKDKENDIVVGSKFDSITNAFKDVSLQEAKENFINSINFLFEREAGYLQGEVTQGEVDTWNTQLREAKEYKANSKNTPTLLNQIAKERNMQLNVLVDKVISKNNAYNEKLGKLIGYRQKLEKEIQNANNLESLKKIQYVSPLNTKGA